MATGATDTDTSGPEGDLTMNYRLALLCLAGALVVALGLSSIPYVGVADADTRALTEVDSAAGSGGAIAAPSSPPAVDLDVGTIERLWRSGALVCAAIVAAFLLLGVLAKVDRARAFYWTSGLATFGFVAETAARGVTPTIGMALGAGAALAGIISRGPILTRPSNLTGGGPPAVFGDLPELAAGPRTATPRAPAERGAVSFEGLVATVGVLAVAALIVACASIRREAKAVAGDVVDCTTAHAHQLTEQFGPLVDDMIRAATQPDGRIDWAPIRAATKSFAVDAGGCVLAAAVLRALTAPAADPAAPQLAPHAPDQALLRAGFDDLRRERFGGVRFRTELGEL